MILMSTGFDPWNSGWAFRRTWPHHWKLQRWQPCGNFAVSPPWCHPGLPHKFFSNCTVQMCPSRELSVIGPQTYLLNACCSALLHMRWRRQSIRTRTFTGRASRRSTISHVSLLLTSLPWITQTSSSPAHTKKLLGGTMPFFLVCIFAVESLTFLTLKYLWAADISEPSYIMVGHFLFSRFAVRRL